MIKWHLNQTVHKMVLNLKRALVTTVVEVTTFFLLTKYVLPTSADLAGGNPRQGESGSPC